MINKKIIEIGMKSNPGDVFIEQANRHQRQRLIFSVKMYLFRDLT